MLTLNKYYEIEYEKNRIGGKQVCLIENSTLFNTCNNILNDPSFFDPDSCYPFFLSNKQIWLKIVGGIPKKKNHVIFTKNKKNHIECYFEGYLPFSLEHYVDVFLFEEKIKQNKQGVLRQSQIEQHKNETKVLTSISKIKTYPKKKQWENIILFNKTFNSLL